jgi:hypothetical protein
MGSIIQMKANSTGGSESGLAQIDVPLDGEIQGVEWTTLPIYDTTLDFSQWQLSFGSAFTNVNDSRQVISNFVSGNLVFTAGGSYIAGLSRFALLPNIRVAMGERLFLHHNGAAGVVCTGFCLISFSFDLDLPKARRR